MLETENAVAVITGGGSGIGEVFAKSWIKAGGRVVIADVAAEKLCRVEKDIKEMGGEVVSTVCDVTKEEDNRALALVAVREFNAINLVAPFAGILRDGFMLNIDRDTYKVSGKMTLAQFQTVIDVNLIGVFLTMRECTEQMIDLGCKGMICLVSSIGSLGTAGQINYSSTKAAMSVIPKVLTAEFFRRNVAHRIRCNAVAPGYVATPMVEGMKREALDGILGQIPIRRLIEPEEISSLIIELYRNEACAGEVFFIHGGLRLGSRG